MSEPKIKRIATATIILQQNGKMVSYSPGEVVEVTEAEYKSLNAVNKGCLKPIEVSTAVAGAIAEQAIDMDAIKAQVRADMEAEAKAKAEAESKAKQTKGKGGKGDADDDL